MKQRKFDFLALTMVDTEHNLITLIQKRLLDLQNAKDFMIDSALTIGNWHRKECPKTNVAYNKLMKEMSKDNQGKALKMCIVYVGMN